jgi:hypothetical protein
MQKLKTSTFYWKISIRKKYIFDSQMPKLGSQIEICDLLIQTLQFYTYVTRSRCENMQL